MPILLWTLSYILFFLEIFRMRWKRFWPSKNPNPEFRSRSSWSISARMVGKNRLFSFFPLFSQFLSWNYDLIMVDSKNKRSSVPTFSLADCSFTSLNVPFMYTSATYLFFLCRPCGLVLCGAVVFIAEICQWRFTGYFTSHSVDRTKKVT